MKNLIWYLFAGTRGGEMRSKIIYEIEKKPGNANQLSKNLKADYKTIQHHLRILLDNGFISVVNKESYGAVYFLSNLMKENIKTLKQIWK